MMDLCTKLKQYQELLVSLGWSGWLFYDFRRSNELACKVLEIGPSQMLTRRFFYWLPAQGEPVKVVHRVEATQLDHLPGKREVYSSWQELEGIVGALLPAGGKVAMEYSPRNAIPYLSKVDAGTLEVIRDFGVEVVSSAPLLQRESVLTPNQLASHYFAAEVVDGAVASAYALIGQKLREGVAVNEYEVQQHILQIFAEKGCMTEGDPIVAVNANSADPHYSPTAERHAPILPGDFVLIDLWCRQKGEGSIYADICRVGVAAREATPRQREIFDIVKQAQELGTDLIRERFAAAEPVMGWEVDARCRQVITDAGYGDFFVHRTGHNIDTKDHGDGAHLDNLETQDLRQILPGTCFSVEPGVYLEDFGVRLEYDIYVHPDGQVEVTGGCQDEVLCLL